MNTYFKILSEIMAKAESKNAGFIFLHRSIREHWVWKDSEKLMWWLDILMECNHSDQKVNIGFELMQCNRGQSLNSLETWSKRWRVDVSTVRRFMSLLENDQMIVRENVLKTTRLTVCNYDSYNNARQAKKSQSNPEAIPKQSRSNTNNNDSNNEVNNDNTADKPHIPKKDLEERQKSFMDQLATYLPLYGKEMVREFYDYWREPNKSKTKMKWEQQDTWALELRLKKWERNSLKFSNGVSDGQAQKKGMVV